MEPQATPARRHRRSAGLHRLDPDGSRPHQAGRRPTFTKEHDMSASFPSPFEIEMPAGFYFQNWDELYGRWMDKVRALIDELEALSFEPLPEREPLEVVTSGRGTGSGYDLQVAYHRLLDLVHKLWQYHFEFLNLGYA